MTRVLTSGIAIVVLLVSSSAASAAEAVPNVRFLDSAPLAIELPTGQRSVTVEAMIFNGTSSSQIVTLDIVGVTGTGTNSAQRLPGAPTPVASGTIPPNSAGSIAATFGLPPEATGSYSGRLVVYAPDGSLDRRDFELTVAGPVALPSAADTLGRPLPATLPLMAWSLVPSPLTWLIPGDTVLLGLPGIKTNLSVDVPVAGPDSIGRLSVTDGLLKISGIDHAGEYSSTVTVGAGDTKETTAVTLKVADFVIYPLLVLFAGLLISAAVDDFLTRRRPRARLEIELTNGQERTLKVQADMLTWLSRLATDAWVSPDLRPIRLIEADNAKSLLAHEAATAFEEFGKAQSVDERDKRWSVPYGTELLRIQGYERDLLVYYDLARTMSSKLATLRLHLPRTTAPMPVLSGLADAWAGTVIETPREFTERKAAIDTSITQLNSFIHLEAETRRLAEKANRLGGDFVTRLADLRELLLGEGADATALLQIDKDLRTLEQEMVKADNSALTGEGTAASLTEQIDLGRFQDRLAVSALSPASAETLRDRLKADEKRFNRLIGMFVVLSWVATVYLTNATFGSLADYLSALLWGVTLTELLKLASRLPVSEIFGRAKAVA